jgi:hypothetical protein
VPTAAPWGSPPGLALAGTVGGVTFPPGGERASTCLPPFAPRPLRRFLAAMETLTPARPTRPGSRLRPVTSWVSALSSFVANGHQAIPPYGGRIVPFPRRSHGFMSWVFPSFCLQPPRVFPSALRVFSQVQRDGRRPTVGPTVAERASPLASRLAKHTRPNRVRHPADRRFTSGCSPPHLAVTQFPSITGALRTGCLEGTCTPQTHDTLRRTSPGLQAWGPAAPKMA